MPVNTETFDTVPPAARPASRRLAGLERAMLITDAVVPFNVVVALRLDGDLAPSALRSALDALQRRHPLLRASVRNGGSKPVFQFEAAGLIPLDEGERQTSESWIAAAEEELGRRFDFEAGPLMRCRYLRGESCGDIVITFQHMIVDATSAVRLIGDLLSLCAGREPAGGGDLSEEGRLPASALFPKQYSGVRFARAVAAFMGSQVADEAWFRRHSRGVRKPVVAERGTCRILPVRFPAALTTALIKSSRRERVTLNAILSAAMMAAVQRSLYPSARAPLRHIVFADLRPRVARTVPEDMLGCFLTMVRLSVMVERDGDFWALARSIQESTGRAERSGERYLAYSLSPGVMKMILGQKSLRWGATAFSYSGPANLPVEYGSFELKGLHAFPSNMTTGPEYSALARLFRGELCCDVLYLDCDMDAAGAREIASGMQAVLEGATC